MPQLDSNLVALSLALLHCKEDDSPDPEVSQGQEDYSDKGLGDSSKDDVRLEVLGNPPLPPLPTLRMVTHEGRDQHEAERLRK